MTEPAAQQPSRWTRQGMLGGLLDRYLLRQLFGIVLFVMLVFTVLWLAPDLLFNALQALNEGKMSFDQALLYLVLHVPTVWTFCIPIAALFASVLLMRQLSTQSELVILLTTGIPFTRITLPFMVMGALLSLLFYINQDYFLPQASQALRSLEQLTETDAAKRAALDPQLTFIEKGHDGSLSKFLIISPSPKMKQHQFVFVFFSGKAESASVSEFITARAGRWDDDRQAWVLQDGVDYVVNPMNIYEKVVPFETRWVETSSIPHQLLQFPEGKPAEYPLKQLEQYIRLLKKGGNRHHNIIEK